MFILVFLNHYIIAFTKMANQKTQSSLRFDSNPYPLGLEPFKHLLNTMRKENCRKRYCYTHIKMTGI